MMEKQKLNEFQEFIISKLSDEQRAAVTADLNQNILVSAGAGTGKTTCLTHRLAWVATASEHKIQDMLAVTFTRAAAEELKERIISIFGIDPEDEIQKTWLPHTGTYHAIAVRILRDGADRISEEEEIPFSSQFTILDEADQLRMIKAAADSFMPASESKLKIARSHAKLIQICLDRNSHECDNPERIEEILRSYPEEVYCFFESRQVNKMHIPAAEIFEKYRKNKQIEQVLDYNDLLQMAVKYMKLYPEITPDYKYILADEYQDTSALQEEFLQLLRIREAPIFCVGDEDQLIYEWRGANLKNIMELDQRIECKMFQLTKNYRSTQNILDLANATLRFEQEPTRQDTGCCKYFNK